MPSSFAADLLTEDPAPPRRRLRVAIVTSREPAGAATAAHAIASMVCGLQARQHVAQVVELPALPSSRSLLGSWSRQRPDVILLATAAPQAWWVLRVARRLQLPVVADFRFPLGRDTEASRMDALRRPMLSWLRWLHRRSQSTLVPNEDVQVGLEALGFADLQVVGLPPETGGLPPPRRSAELRQQWGAGPDTLVALCVSPLLPDRHLELAAEAIRHIVRSGRDARLVLVGDGPFRKSLERRCLRTVFAGDRRGNDLAAHLASADLLLCPSPHGPGGGGVVKAMASGLPVLAFSGTAAATCLRHAETGFLARAGDPEHFLALACDLARQPTLLQAVGRRARVAALALDGPSPLDELESTLLQTTLSHMITRRSLALRPAGA